MTIITALNSQISREKTSENLARALLILGGRFSCTGEPCPEIWLLQQAGFETNSGDSSYSSRHVYDDLVQSVSFVSNLVDCYLYSTTIRLVVRFSYWSKHFK